MNYSGFQFTQPLALINFCTLITNILYFLCEFSYIITTYALLSRLMIMSKKSFFNLIPNFK